MFPLSQGQCAASSETTSPILSGEAGRREVGEEEGRNVGLWGLCEEATALAVTLGWKTASS